jgi:hypothetical protein
MPDAASFSNASSPAANAGWNWTDDTPPPIVNRDPADIRAIALLARAGLALIAVLFVSLGFNLWQYWRRPDRIVVDLSSGRTIAINDRTFGGTDGVRMEPEQKPVTEQKVYVAKKVIGLLSQIDPVTREKDLAAALKAMTPPGAYQYAGKLKADNLLATQRSENWQATWEVQSAELDPRDPYLVRILGLQKIIRRPSGESGRIVEEARQLSFEVKLVRDPAGRRDENFNTGLLVHALKEKTVSQTTAEQPAVLPAGVSVPAREGR